MTLYDISVIEMCGEAASQGELLAERSDVPAERIAIELGSLHWAQLMERTAAGQIEVNIVAQRVQRQ